MICQLSLKIVLLFRAHFFINLEITSASSLHDLLIANHQHATFNHLCMLTHTESFHCGVFSSYCAVLNYIYHWKARV